MTDLFVEKVILWLLENRVAHFSLIATNLTNERYRELIKIYDDKEQNCLVLRCEARNGVNGVAIEPETFVERFYPWDDENKPHLLGGIRAHLNRLNGWWTDPRFQELNSPEHRLTMLELGMRAKQIRERGNKESD